MDTATEVRDMADQKEKGVEAKDTDSSISMTFDSGDCGYKSGECKFGESGGKLEPTFDSGLVPDCEVAMEQPDPRKLLLEDIFAQDKDGDTILHLAVVEARSDILYPLLQLVPHPDFLDISNNLFQTVLHLACLRGRADVVRRLVVGGASLDVADRGGNSPLHLACRRGDADCVRAILAHIQEGELPRGMPYAPFALQRPDLSPLIDAKNYDGQASVHLAAAGGFSKVMECLHTYGADINNQEGKSGRTPLHYAVEGGNSALVEFLLHTCGADPQVPNYAGHLPLEPPASTSSDDEEVDREELFQSLVNARN